MYASFASKSETKSQVEALFSSMSKFVLNFVVLSLILIWSYLIEKYSFDDISAYKHLCLYRFTGLHNAVEINYGLQESVITSFVLIDCFIIIILFMKFYSTDSNTQMYQLIVLQIHTTKDLVNSRDQSEWIPCLAFRKVEAVWEI